MKLCSKCRNTKSLTEFYRNQSQPGGYHYYCKPCKNEADKEYKSRDPDRYREHARKSNRRWKLRNVYKMSETDYLRLLNLHQHKCHICNQPFSADLADHIDHDHTSHRVRGILCGNCNWALGLFKDNPALLRQAADYLEKHQ